MGSLAELHGLALSGGNCSILGGSVRIASLSDLGSFCYFDYFDGFVV